MQYTSRKIIEITPNKIYEQKRQKLCDDFLFNIKHKTKVEFSKKTSNLFRDQSHIKAKKIDVHNFNKVIFIDIKNKTAMVEAMIRFEDLVNETLKYDLLPPVVPQLKTITLGGAVSGIGIEASSFQYGLVHETVLEMEVMLADGRIVICSPTNKYSDLFFALPNSYGTLGYILKIKIQLIESKKYVKVLHHKYINSNKYFTDLAQFCNDKKHDFVDGVVFDERNMYISTAQFVDNAPNVSDYKYMQIYYQSIVKNKIDYLTASDYIWRWDTDWFWCSKLFGMQNKLFRLLFGKFILGSKSYWKIARLEEKYKIREKIEKTLTGKIKQVESVVQDVCIPIENCEKFLKFFRDEIGIKPIWICPFQAYNKNKIFTLFNLEAKKLYVDFGFWDVVPSGKPRGYYNKLIEEKVEELGGKKSLYSTSYYERDKFWQIFNGIMYRKLKQKYDPKNIFPDLYSRCVKNK
jgi:FAD/FMN-containing dehydrogenase